jgi:putative lipoprotein
MRGTLARACGLLWMVTLVAGCANLATPAAFPVLDEAALANGRYSVSSVPGGPFELVKGEGVLPAGQGSEAGATLALLAAPRARGDINGDGSEDVAAILSVTKPGTAVSFELVLVLNQAGQPQQAASAALGEGIEVRGVTIDRGQVVVATLGRPPGTSSAAQPSIVRVRTFAYQGQALVEGPATEVAMSSLTGTLTYRERVALPPEAIVTVQLVDITQPNAPAILISEQSFASQGSQVPLAFVLAFAPAAIDERNAYAAQAAIEVEGKLLFRTTQQYLVITHGNPTTIDILLERVD